MFNKILQLPVTTERVSQSFKKTVWKIGWCLVGQKACTFSARNIEKNFTIDHVHYIALPFMVWGEAKPPFYQDALLTSCNG